MVSEKCDALYIEGYYSAAEKKEIMKFELKWIELDNFILTEVTQKQKDKHHICGS